MSAVRSLFTTLFVVFAAGCSKPPAVDGTLSGSESKQKRAAAGVEASVVGPISSEVIRWELRKRKDVDRSVTKSVDGECLVVTVRFTTTDDTTKHSTAMMLLTSGNSCKDEFGNSYTIDAYATEVVGDNVGGSVTRETPVTRVLLVERPIPKATRLDLDLSADFVGSGKGKKFQFAIPMKQ